MESTSLRFAEAARCLADATRPRRLVAPSFRSPPRIPGDRSIRKRVDGGATVAVRYRGRPWPAVLADMVEGVVVTNDLVAEPAARLRTDLWRALERADLVRPDDREDMALPARSPVPAAAAPEATTTVKRLARVA
jgi:hypothetical protein